MNLHVAGEVGEAVPGAKVAVSNLPFDVGAGDGAPGRLLMVDRETILLSARTEGLVPTDVTETGLWGSEVGHGLIAWLGPLLSSRIEQLEFAETER